MAKICVSFPPTDIEAPAATSRISKKFGSLSVKTKVYISLIYFLNIKIID